MQRLITNPLSYNAIAVKTIEPGAAWDFSTDQDLKQGIGQLNASAQDEVGFTNIQNATKTLTTGQASIIQQEFIEPGQNKGLWHYRMEGTCYSDVPGVIIFPFVMQAEDADGDSAKYMFLPATKNMAGLMSTAYCEGSVIRNYSGTDDDGVFVFGFLLWNMHSATCIIKNGMYTMDIHPLSKPLIFNNPQV